jgi:Protein of unknown function (DUF3109)
MPNPQDIELPVYNGDLEFEIEGRIGRTKFACDLSVCKGACCTMPGAVGAPILEHEIAELERVLPAVLKYLPQASIDVIEQKGVFVRDNQGGLSVPVVNNADCVFVTYEGDIAFCAIEQAHRKGEISGFPKPISCHLFPIRIYPTQRDNTYYVCYEEFDECEGGRSRGKSEEIPLIDFLTGPLSRALGEERVERLKEVFSEPKSKK